MGTSSQENSLEGRETLLALDGYSLMFRAYFAMPPMQGPSGPSNALFGFFRMLTSAVQQFHPRYLAVALDHPSATFRDDLFADYKGGRASTPEELRFQLEAVRGLLSSLCIPTVERSGYEADDVIATLARLASTAGVTTEIVTGDRDILQLIADPMVRVHLTRRGVSDLETMDEQAVVDKYGVTAQQYCDFAVLRGDKSDNLPGVRGIGPKTAAELISRFGGIDGILSALSTLPPRQRAALEEAANELPLYRQLAELDRNVPLDIALAELDPPTAIDVAGAEKLFVNSFGLRTVFASLRTIFGDSSAKTPESPGQADGSTGMTGTRRVNSWDELHAIEHRIVSVAAHFEGERGRGAPDRIGFGTPDVDQATNIWITSPSGLAPVRDEINGISWAGIGLKEIVRSLALNCAMTVTPSELVDLGVLAYVLDASERRSDLAEIANLLGLSWLGTGGDGLFDHEELGIELAAVPGLLERMLTRVREEGVERLAMEIEVPLVKVLAKMEVTGVRIDTVVLEEIGATLASEAHATLDGIHAYTDPGFNPNSPKQLGAVLFDQLGLPTGKRTKTGYSTDARVLESLRDQHPLVGLVLKFRELDKLRSTFYEGLRAEVASDGRIHATFNQTVARTGRISSEHPNLQNIPVRSEEGRQFRRVFVAAPGSLLVAADYSQIELRILAHLSQDERLIEALSGTGDVHSLVAASVYGIDPSEVSYEQRSVAKMVAYGLSYGMESYGLATRLGVSNQEAEAILASFFSAYPGLVRYRDSVISQARDRGYTTTLLGRRRYLPELASPNRAIRQGAERQAMNAPTQGLAADIFKMALVALDSELSRTNARLVLQVHDEVVVEAPEPEADSVARTVQEVLANVYPLAVPLVVNVGIGADWAQARA